MKKSIKFGFAAIAAVAILFSSCGKYEEGPKISFASKKGRLCREWTLESTINGSNGVETPCTSSCGSIEYKKDGAVYDNGVSVSGVTWQFSSDKEKLETVWGSVTFSETILRLTSKELWLKDISSGDQAHYKAK